MPSTLALGARAYVGVPVVLGDGRLYGTLCGLDPTPQGLSDEQVALMQLLARLVASHLDYERIGQQKNEFLASASHDLKNPLAAIKGTAQMLRRRLARTGFVDSERLDAGLAAVDASVVQMAGQIDRQEMYRGSSSGSIEPQT